MDLSPLIRAGFTRRQARTLSENIGSGGGTGLASLPPFVPLAPGSRIQELVEGHLTGNAEWDNWFGVDGGAVYHLGTFTAMETTLIALPYPMPYIAGHEPTPDSTGVTAVVVPADTPTLDWNTSDGGNGAWVNFDGTLLPLKAGRPYEVFLASYDTEVGHTIQADYSVLYNELMPHMLPPGEVCSVLSTDGELYLIPNPIVVRSEVPHVEFAQLVSIHYLSSTEPESPNTTHPVYLAPLVPGQHGFGNNLERVGATWRPDLPEPVLQASLPGQKWMLTVAVVNGNDVSTETPLAPGDAFYVTLGFGVTSSNPTDHHRRKLTWDPILGWESVFNDVWLVNAIDPDDLAALRIIVESTVPGRGIGLSITAVVITS